MNIEPCKHVADFLRKHGGKTGKESKTEGKQSLKGTTTISCPFCTSDTLVILNGMDGELDLVSDCENCCRPNNVKATVKGVRVVGLETE